MDRKPVDSNRRSVGHLGRVQEHERLIARRLSDARDEAEGIVEAAREEARRTHVESERSLAARSERIRREIREDVRARRREILEAAADRVRRLDAIPEERIEELADGSFLRLIGREEAP